MLAVWSWLLELVEFDREISAEEGAAALTGAGLEVEEFRRVGDNFTGVVIAEVVSKEKHPEADKLTIVYVKDAANAEPTLVICGAANVPEPGGRVLWAKPGAVLPGGFTLGAKKLKGILSAGMLCAEDELGLGEDHDGIVVLGPDASELELGSDAAEALGLRDVVFDLCIPANRADALGHWGIARELAALLGGRAVPPNTALPAKCKAKSRAAGSIAVEVASTVSCPRYVARVVEGLTVGPSPLWMQQRLRHVGVRPISNLVDVSNYVMYELGQPLHAFDYKKIQGNKIVVRTAKAGEQMTTLDGVERRLQDTDVLICDGTAPVALAGVMGGQTSEVSDSTTTVLLESAIFDAMSVRRTARRLGLHSDASYRFERAVDPNGADLASQRAALLLAQVGGGKVQGGAVDCYPEPVLPTSVTMRLSRCAALTGIAVDRATVVGTLERQGLKVVDPKMSSAKKVVVKNSDVIEVLVPTARADIRREVDVIEEVVRIYGFDRVPATLPKTTVRPKRVVDKRPVLARRALVQAGYCESLSYGFTSPKHIADLGFAPDDVRTRPIALDNPMTLERSVMRTSLWSNLLLAVAHNLNRGVQDIRLFELGSVFLKEAGEICEPQQLCIVLAGHGDGWLRPGANVDFFDAKGAVIAVLEGLYGTSDGFEFVANAGCSVLHPGISASIVDASGSVVGRVGEIHLRVRHAFEIDTPVFGVELELGKLPAPASLKMTAIPKYPSVTRDISMLLDVEHSSAKVRAIINDDKDPMVASVQVLEDYRDPAHIPVGQKGMLWSVTYRSATGTLTDVEVDKVHQAIEKRLLSELGATRR